MRGFRVLAYSGGNTRVARQEAERWGQKAKEILQTEPIYVHFYSPRWMCQIGNYTSYEQARKVMRRFKERRLYPSKRYKNDGYNRNDQSDRRYIRYGLLICFILYCQTDTLNQATNFKKWSAKFRNQSIIFVLLDERTTFIRQ